MRTVLICLAIILAAFAVYASIASSGSQKLQTSVMPIGALLDGHLVSQGGEPFHPPSTAPIASLRYYAFYYAAQWCPPCHTFTPRLVKWYNAFKPTHPNFELIFISEDHDKAAMLAYMKEMAMPWPAFSFDDLDHEGKAIEKFAGSGIPDLVLVDAGGRVLSADRQLHRPGACGR
jgi:nucleoredoxin